MNKPNGLRTKKGFLSLTNTQGSDVPYLGLCSNSSVCPTAWWGGATTYEGVYAFTPVQLQPKLTLLKRRVGDFLDYSISPTSINLVSPSIAHTMLLPIKQLHSHIHFPSPFSHNGFGYRCLTHMERLSLFGLPSVIPVGSQTFAIPPVQWSSAILHPSLTLQPIHPIDAVSLPLPPIHDDRGFSVMPHINVKLSHDWCLPAMSSTGAAKKDSAVVIQDLWDQSILLPSPHVTPQSLNQFRRLLMTKLYDKLCK